MLNKLGLRSQVLSSRTETGQEPAEGSSLGMEKDGGQAVAQGLQLLEQLWQDLRYGGRTLIKQPGFTLVVVLTLALGIGANTAVFSLVDAFLLKTLPVKEPRELVIVEAALPNGKIGSTFPYPTFEQFRDQSQSFSGIFACDNTQVSITVDGKPEIIWGDFVSGSYFNILGVNAIIGRVFSSDDDIPGKDLVAVVSYDYWERRFARNPSIIGKTLYLGMTSVTVIGVTPPGFFGRNVSGRSVKFGRSADMVFPMFMQSQFGLRDHKTFQLMARLKPGVSPELARANLDVIYQQVLAQQPRSQPAAQGYNNQVQSIRLRPGHRGASVTDDNFAFALQVLFAVVGIVLLIACVNVANLLLARAESRRKEIAVRLSIGASRSRLIRQLLTESALLGLLGGAVGMLFAKWGVDIILTVLSYEEESSIPFDLVPDSNILMFTIAISLAAGMLFGLAPAITATRVNLSSVLNGNDGTTNYRPLRRRLGSALVIAQIALSLTLLVGAGLLIRTLQQLYEVDTGFEREKILTMWVNPSLIGYDHAKEMTLYSEVLEKINSMPGVQSASLARFSLTRSGNNIVGPRFFETMGIGLLQGREFTPADTKTSPKVAIISESMARNTFQDENPIGQRLPDEIAQRFNGGDIQVIGVVRNTKHRLRQQKWDDAVYIPYSQAPPQRLGQVKLLVCAVGDPLSLVPSIRYGIQSVEKHLALEGIETQSAEMTQFIAEEQSLATLLSFFGALALILGSIGLYGTISYGVRRRTKELGIRMALGAQKSNVLWMVLRETLWLVVLGVVIGVPLALMASRLISSMLFGIKATDLLTISAAILLMFAVALLAGYIPARRATNVDPMIALRHE